MSKIGYFVGIDPGATGAVAIVLVSGKLHTWAKFDRRDPLQVLDLILDPLITNHFGEFSVGLENVHAAPGQGVVSMFSFGKALGRLEGWLRAYDIAPEQVSPQVWQRWLPGGEESDGPKDRARKGAAAKWGLSRFLEDDCRVPHTGGIDAAGIAEFLRLQATGEIKPFLTTTGRKKKRLRPIRF